ncbi:hypothetical protein DVS28_b0570 (plasmid) [Euzebya pacifica]|uniref:Uncharacterized protein n=1 Tax=Euzebya pacifica TaxID=1608957 RepID=A0A346Y763_9ACTN|nr:hypothetical protein [Euzebya pacifica]AXV10310.1 hypothetical protein DVS28_b0570 [Euzebya pacifica]
MGDRQRLAAHPDPLVRRLAALTFEDLLDMQDRGVLTEFNDLLQQALIDMLTKANERLRRRVATLEGAG